ncbi:hypothetical protein DERP_006894 [Dermatophagoides pteronyssinus]|uniref:Uncharacterized protein n=1 Tax=Dermatophagoides pteronyssinus TaxID=6956 RepID=A0ABQ8ISB5_DERPT|nr:hypothetical protein DERP_006894 [Dermatophagoides pteronyssinus]
MDSSSMCLLDKYREQYVHTKRKEFSKTLLKNVITLIDDIENSSRKKLLNYYAIIQEKIDKKN